MSDESEAVKAIAEASKSGIDGMREFGAFIAGFIGGPLTEISGMVQDRLSYMRIESHLQLMKKAKTLMHEIGMSAPTRSLPMKFAIPLFSGASLEDDDDLQVLWASLLVNAANAESGIDQSRVYIDILERLSPLEAKILNTIYSFPFDKIQHNGVFTYALPDNVFLGDENAKKTDLQPNYEIAKALSRLNALGCIKFKATWGGGENYSWVNPTLLGDSFVRACRVVK